MFVEEMYFCASCNKGLEAEERSILHGRFASTHMGIFEVCDEYSGSSVITIPASSPEQAVQVWAIQHDRKQLEEGERCDIAEHLGDMQVVVKVRLAVGGPVQTLQPWESYEIKGQMVPVYQVRRVSDE